MYKFRTRHETEQGNKLAADEDIFRSISEGLHGTSMPGWATFFPLQITQLVQYIKTFAPVYADDKPGAKLDLAAKCCRRRKVLPRARSILPRPLSATCHGMAGRGNGQQALDGLQDDWGERIWPANLTRPWTYRGGMLRRDIFRNIALGINGTPMPVFGDSAPLDAELRQQIWHTVNYVQSLWTQAAEPEVKSVLVAKRVKGALPTTPDDAAWKTVPRIIIRWWDKSSRNAAVQPDDCRHRRPGRAQRQAKSPSAWCGMIVRRASQVRAVGRRRMRTPWPCSSLPVRWGVGTPVFSDGR